MILEFEFLNEVERDTWKYIKGEEENEEKESHFL